jgi:hypothetical protein
MAILAMATGTAMAQDVVGDWQGTLRAGATELRLVLHLSKSKTGRLQGTVESIDQAPGFGMEITAASFLNSELRLSLTDYAATYEGRMNAAGAIDGTWTQGMKLPLTWERKAAEAAKPADVAAYAGDWHGDLDLRLATLYLVIHIATAGGELTATLDSPDQGGPGVRATSAAIEGEYLKIEWKEIGAVFRGRIANDPDSLEGSFVQSGMPGMLKLKRVRDAADLVRRRPQMPVCPFPYREEEVRYRNPRAKGRVTLAGTLTIPPGEGPFPAAILIAGSGSLDRDETVAGHKPFLVLADYLTRRGIAVLRADKRGAGESGGDSAKALTADYASDVEAGVAFLRTRPEVDGRRIGLVGHSEGGVIAPMVAAEDRGIAFAVLMAGTGVPGEELVAEQIETSLELSGSDAATAARWGDAARKVVAALKISRDPAAAKEALTAKDGFADAMASSLIARITATPWLRAFVAIDPRVALRGVTCPVLAINGSKDKQVPAGPNLAGIRQALQDGKNLHFEVEEMPGLNHMFQTAETGAPLEYGHIEETMSPVALERIAAWIRAVTHAK